MTCTRLRSEEEATTRRLFSSTGSDGSGETAIRSIRGTSGSVMRIQSAMRSMLGFARETTDGHSQPRKGGKMKTFDAFIKTPTRIDHMRRFAPVRCQHLAIPERLVTGQQSTSERGLVKTGPFPLIFGGNPPDHDQSSTTLLVQWETNGPVDPSKATSNTPCPLSPSSSPRQRSESAGFPA